ncbi:hypothetical protein AAFF_G00033370 [Aldrovandia affinis]|uniref:Small integral membrane protein 29 n=1 Tax=Aldrovandia affinis TaxID=143900 RepID=A0AAD7WFR5_9TELE|nr:hypothetical protein AAFF_G00033370 [Aldrovandia affinis]
MNTTTTTPSVEDDGMFHYILVPIFLVTVIGIAFAGVMYASRKRRIDRLRHQLLPVYAYDPSEEEQETEQEVQWRNENMNEGWAGLYQHRRPLLMKHAST